MNSIKLNPFCDVYAVEGTVYSYPKLLRSFNAVLGHFTSLNILEGYSIELFFDFSFNPLELPSTGLYKNVFKVYVHDLYIDWEYSIAYAIACIYYDKYIKGYSYYKSLYSQYRASFSAILKDVFIYDFINIFYALHTGHYMYPVWGNSKKILALRSILLTIPRMFSFNRGRFFLYKVPLYRSGLEYFGVILLVLNIRSMRIGIFKVDYSGVYVFNNMNDCWSTT